MTTKNLESNLNLANADRGVWLVKVPKYIHDKWEKAPGHIEAAKLKITKYYKQKAEVALTLSEACLALKEPDEYDIPKQHMLDVTTVINQTMGVFSNSDTNNESDSPSDGIFMEGKIVQKLECRPHADETYMKLKLDKFKKASIPQRQVKQLSKAVHNFKPVSDHRHNIEYAEKKKNEGKKMRDDKHVVLEMLFAAFEKHQYYNIKDLVKLTRQPVVYLKEILNEVCNYNLKNPHRNMWELKPEYRHYKVDKPPEDEQKKENDSD